ncbi:hypothetical protein CB0940_11467 [Cercospora beticola]|uniref:Uncharacterized protein n=1 Tax=Cercospora beticola TaxID=122368 RepID=A0A2G5HCY1_CERBT|nr:hypothetical protein CB0940_11467 [Cercospora beticola]PIA90400.1 hypothetical protein CB0940_11467 [Cercospora beticola]WPB08326.1 hypothetical protein RHO25_012992 [Cercospora beticola]CAK1367788.1 unnamed protein product [Cercospora beticola]
MFTPSMATLPALLLLLLPPRTQAWKPWPPIHKLTDINVQPFWDTSCTDDPYLHDPALARNDTGHREIYMKETFRDAGHCYILEEPAWFGSFNFRFGKLRSEISNYPYPPDQDYQQRVGYDESIGGCIIEVYKGYNCGSRQPHLIHPYVMEKPIYVILNVSAGFLLCYALELSPAFPGVDYSFF